MLKYRISGRFASATSKKKQHWLLSNWLEKFEHLASGQKSEFCTLDIVRSAVPSPHFFLITLFV